MGLLAVGQAVQICVSGIFQAVSQLLPVSAAFLLVADWGCRQERASVCFTDLRGGFFIPAYMQIIGSSPVIREMD